MCITVTRTVKLEQGMRVWKRVEATRNKQVFKSPVAVIYRTPQNSSDRGKILKYEIGKTSTSKFDKTAGIYVYYKKPFMYSSSWIQCYIPKSTVVKYGSKRYDGYILTTERIRVRKCIRREV